MEFPIWLAGFHCKSKWYSSRSNKVIGYSIYVSKKYHSHSIILAIYKLSGPAPEGFTNKLFELTKTISEYKICPDLEVDISSLGSQSFTVDGKKFTVEVIDSVEDYMIYMQELFDFEAIRGLLSGSDGRPPFPILLNAMHGGERQICLLFI